MALQFDIETVREDVLERQQRGFRRPGLAFREEPPDRPCRTAGQADQPVVLQCEIGQRDRRLGAGLAVEKSPADQGHQIAVTGLALDQQHNAVGLSRVPVSVRGTAVARAAIRRERDLAADDRLDTGLGAGGGEFERAEQIAAVGDRHRRHRLAAA